MRKFLTSLLVLCFATATSVSIAHAQPPAKQVNPIVIIMGAGGNVTADDQNGPANGTGTTAAPEKAKPGNPLDNGGPLPEDLQKFFQQLFNQAHGAPAKPTPQQLEAVYQNIWGQINATYYNHDALKDFGVYLHKYDGKLTTQAELEAAVKDMAGSLHDRWTSYTTSDEIKQSMNQAKAGLEPLGMMFKQHQDGSYYIDYVMYGTPAQKSILRKGDTVKSINGKDLAGLTPAQVEQLTLVKAGDDAQIVAVIDKQEVAVTLKSAATDEPDFQGKLLPGNIAFVRLPSFESEDMAAGLAMTLQQLYKESGGQINGLVLDLRGNPGGVFDVAQEIASMFLSEGTVVMTTTRTGLMLHEERFSVIKAWPHDFGDAPAQAIAFAHMLETVPMTVLTDGNSASCAEILTGALKDNGRAVIVGETTYGKGVGYQSGRSRAGGWLSITSLSYLTPSGYNLANKGIVPNLVVVQPRASALDVQLNAGIQAVKMQQMTPAKPKEQSSPLGLIDTNSVIVQAGLIALFLLAITLFGVHQYLKSQRENKKNGGK